MTDQEYDPTEPDLYLFNEIFGEEIRRSGDAQPEMSEENKALYDRQKAYWESKRATAETEAEDAGVLNRAVLEPQLLAIANSDQEDWQKRQDLAVAIQEHSGCHYERDTLLKRDETYYGGKRYRVPAWIADIEKSLHNEKRLLIISQKYEVGEIVECDGKRYLVTTCSRYDGSDVADAEEGFDAFLFVGWNSVLVNLDAQVMSVLSEQYKVGKVVFTSHETVKFPDEEYAQSVFDLVYSPDLGLYDKTKVGG